MAVGDRDGQPRIPPKRPHEVVGVALELGVGDCSEGAVEVGLHPIPRPRRPSQEVVGVGVGVGEPPVG
jgi:hypothetical protein